MFLSLTSNYVVKDDMKLLIPLPPPKFWDCRWTSSRLFMWCWGLIQGFMMLLQLQMGYILSPRVYILQEQFHFSWQSWTNGIATFKALYFIRFLAVSDLGIVSLTFSSIHGPFIKFAMSSVFTPSLCFLNQYFFTLVKLTACRPFLVPSFKVV